MKRTVTNTLLVLLFIFVFLLVHGCSINKRENIKSIGESKTVEFIDVKSKTVKGVIVPKEYFLKDDPDGNNYWTIRNFDFDNLEDRLEKYLRNEADLQYFFAEDLPDKFREYRRQYVGTIVDGRKKIYINFFCTQEDDWKQRLIHVWDGWYCFFSVEYDIKTKKFSELWVNGEA